MGMPAEGSIDHLQFVGMVSNADPHDIDAGAAQIQINVNIVTPGLLRVRGGLRAVQFETE